MTQTTQGRTRDDAEDEIPPVPRQQVPQVPEDDVPDMPDERLPELAEQDIPEPPDPAVPPVEQAFDAAEPRRP